MFLKYYLFLIEIVLVLSILLRRNNSVSGRLFISFMLFTFIIEIIAITLAEKYDANNLWLYNIYIIAAFLFWYYWFAVRAKLKMQAAVVACIYSVIAIGNLVFFQRPMTLNHYTFLAGTFGYLLLYVLWIYEILKNEKSYTDSALLLFFTAGLTYFTGFTVDIILYPTGMLSKIIYNKIDLDMVLVNAVNTFFYGMLALSLLAGYASGKKAVPI